MAARRVVPPAIHRPLRLSPIPAVSMESPDPISAVLPEASMGPPTLNHPTYGPGHRQR